MKKLIILGASGNLGTQTIDIVNQHKDEFEVIGLSIGKNIKCLENILSTNRAKYVCVQLEDDYLYLKDKYKDIQFFFGDEGLIQLSSIKEADLLFNCLQGFIGLKPTIAAIEAGIDIAIANKETLVAAGSIVTEAAKINNVKLIPVDSEHSAIYQCLLGNEMKDVKRLVITASGGSFRDLNREQLADVTVESALKHPRWSMGHKITIDSATMMNKGFEVIEAHWLFDIPYEKIDVILHPQSIVHSMVEYVDHSVIAQLGVTDMRVPIQFALTQPTRLTNNIDTLDLTEIGKLEFSKMDMVRFPLLKLAYDLGKKGGNLTAVMNGANEAAVRLFLEGKCSFLDIEKYIFEAVENCKFIKNPTLDDIIESNDYAIDYVRKINGE